MALSPSHRARIVAELPAPYRKKFEEGTLSDEQLEFFAQRIGMQLPQEAPNATPKPAATAKSPSVLEDIGNALAAGQESFLGGVARSVGSANVVLEETPALRGPTRVAYMIRDALAPEAGAKAIQDAELIRQTGEQLSAKAEGRLASIDSTPIREVAETASDLAGSPSSLGSIPGGAFGAIPIADVYSQEYAKARAGGLDQSQSTKRAAIMASPELISIIPTAGRIPGVKQVVTAPLRTTAERIIRATAGTALKEGTEETVVTAAQEGANALLAKYGDEDQQRFATAQASTDIFNDMWRSFKAGAAGGGVGGGVVGGLNAAAENGRRAADIMSGDALAGRKLREQAAMKKADEATSTNKAAEVEKAYAAVDTSPDAQRVSDEQEAGFRTMELRRKAEEELAKNPGNTMALKLRDYTVTPEMVASERAKDASATAEIAKEEQRIKEVEALAPYKEQAKKDINSSLLNELSKSKAKHAATKRKAAVAFVEEAKKLPEADRIDFLARKRLEWDAANPAPTLERVKAKYNTQATAPATDVKDTTASVAPDANALAAAEEAPAATMSEDAIRQFGLSSKSDTITSVTSESVLANLRQNVGKSREHAALGKLIADGKLVLVDTAEQIPGYNENMKGDAGYYDGNRMYITADKIDPENIKGSMLVVAAHESKHAADISGAGKSGAASISNLIGKQANAVINKKIMQEASNGSPAAELAVKAVENMDAKTAELELPAYYISAVMSRRGAGTGQAFSDLVSAIRTKYRAITKSSDVNVNDIGYMANKLVQNLAVSKETIKGDVKSGLGMVVGEMHSDFAKRDSQGLVYKDIDKKRKTLISDADSTLKIETLPKLLEPGEEVLFSDLVDTPSLRGNYAPMASTPVRINTSLARGAAQLTPTKNGSVIELSPDLLEEAQYDPSRVKGILLHEMQHVVQFAEDFARGGTDVEFYSNEDKKLFNEQAEVGKELTTYLNKVFRLDGEMAAWDITPLSKRMIADVMADYDNSKVLTSREVSEIIDGIIQREGTSSKTVLDTVAKFKAIADLNASLNVRARERRARADDKYRKLLGEREARFTQNTHTKSQEELDTLLRPRYYGESLVAENTRVTAVNVDAASNDNVPEWGLSSKPLNESVEEAKAILTGKKSRYLAKTAAGQFSGFGVLGRALGNIKELADGEAASIAYVAEGDYYRTKFGIKMMAKRRGMPLSKANEEVDKVLQEAAKIEDVPRREAYIGRYVATNPELRPLGEALDNIAKQSKALVAARARDPRPMSEEEIAKYTAIINNRYAYFTKTYAAFQGEEGRKRNTRLKREADLANKKVAEGKAVPAKYKHAQAVYNNAVKFVAANDVAVFDPSMLAEQPLDRIDYLYSLWVGDPNTLRDAIRNDRSVRGDTARKKAYRAAAEIAIAEAGKSVDQDAIRRESQYVVDGMLGLNEQSNPVITYYRGAKEDTSILKSRTVLPAEVSDLYGEVTDIPTKVAITLAKQGELAARMRMLSSVKDVGDGKWFVDKSKYASSDEYAAFTEELSGEQWGPLDGIRVKPEIAAALTDGLDIFTPLSTALAQGGTSAEKAAVAAGKHVMSGLRRMSGLQKFVQIVLSPYNVAVNFLGSGIVVAQNGGAKPDDMLRALKASMTLLNNQLAPQGIEGKMSPMTTNPDLELFLKYTLLDSAVGQELRSMPTKFLKQLVNDLEATTTMAQANKIISRAWAKLGNAKSFAAEAFALSDAWVKPAVFLSRVRFLERVNAAENKGWDRATIEKMAADVTKDTTITFQRAAPLVKLTESLPLTWYATYMQGVFRSVMYSYGQASRDLIEATRAATPEGQLLYALEGSKRLAGATAATVGAAAATKALAGALNDDDDESYLDGAKKLLYAEGRYGDGVYVGKNANDMPVFMRLSRLDPNGPINDILRILMSEDDTETKQRAVIDHIKNLWIMPRTTADSAKLVYSMFSDEPVKNRNTKVERVLPATAAMFKDMLPADYGTAEAFVQLIDGFVPGVANSFDQEFGQPKSDRDWFEKATGWALMISGGRFDVADHNAAAFGAGNRLDTLQKEGRAQVYESLKIGGAYAALNKYIDLREAELDAYSKLRDVYSGMVQMGYSPAKAAGVLKDNKVQAQDIAVIRQARTPGSATGLISKDSLEKAGGFYESKLPKGERKDQAEKDRKAATEKLLLLLKENE